MSYQKHLNILKRKLASGQMSLLVGSGFSKNVSVKFPSWDELLYDLVCEEYSEEIETSFSAHIKTTHKRSRLTHRAFVKQKVSSLLRQKGYLKVVNDYVSRKGYGESIAAYIEHRTPYIHRTEDNIILTTGHVPETIEQERLSLHRAILALPWNNIYTTNYDELLDFCIQPGVIEELQHKIKLINAEIVALNQKESTIREALSKLDAEKTVTDLPPSPLDFADTPEPESSDEQPTKNPAQRRYELNYELNNTNKRKEEKEQQVRYLEISINNSYQVITHAAGLKLRRNRNIIKLHGSLRSPNQQQNNQFEFDGDHQNQYIISGEDYKNYPEKHEAFTQLMRISLLQESFCLIGFSGVDPNFLAWVGWVRSILQQQAAKNNADQDYKIYLIDVIDEKDPADRLLFFENHSIIRIPITKTEILTLLGAKTTEPEKVSIRESIRVFLDYLAADEELTPVIPLKDLSEEQDRKAVWRDLHFAEPQKKLSIQSIRHTVKELDKLADNIFLPDINHAYSFNQHSLLATAGNQLNFYPDDAEGREWVCRLLVHAAKDYYVPIYNVLETEIIDIIAACPSVHDQALALAERAYSLNAATEHLPNHPYENILRLAYSMQFGELKKALDNWRPHGKGLIQKAGFFALFDAPAARQLIEDELNNYDNFNGEERLYALELLSYFKLSKSWSRDKRLDKTIGQYKHTGFRRLDDNFDYLQGQLAPKPEKIQPYGTGRFSTGRSVQWVTFTKPEMAAQYLMLLAESGVQMCLPQVSFQSAEEWYPVFRSGFELYPEPFLYYSAQYGSNEILRRIGQDYAFSQKLASRLPRLVENLFRCKAEAPSYIQRHTYMLLAEMIEAVAPEHWADSFLKSWKDDIKTDRPFVARREAENTFYTKGLKYLTDAKAMQAIIMDCLEAILAGKEGGIDYLYQLNFNLYFKRLLRNKKIPAFAAPQIDLMIAGLPGKVDTNLFALGNIYHLLNPQQIETIQSILKEEDYSYIRHVRIWHIILYFVYKDKPTVQKVKQALLQHHALWYTGIEGTRISGGIESIDISRLTKGPENHRGVTWTAKELSLLYNKITQVLSLIQSIPGNFDGFATFTDVLEDMLVFLQDHRKKLIKKKDFEATMALCSALFNEQRDFNEPVQGLLSDDNSPVVWAIHALNRQLRVRNLDSLAFGTLLSKCMLQHQPGLEASLQSISVWVTDKQNKDQLEIYRLHFRELFNRYLDSQPVDTDIAYVHEKLTLIALGLQKWGIKELSMQQWLAKMNESHFNSVKQVLVKQNARS